MIHGIGVLALPIAKLPCHYTGHEFEPTRKFIRIRYYMYEIGSRNSIQFGLLEEPMDQIPWLCNDLDTLV